LGKSPAVLLQGHGATTVGNSLDQAVLAMMGLEEQAKMNYLALAALGPGYPHITDAMLDAADNRPPLGTLPHFAKALAGGGQPAVNGVWTYYTDLAERAIASGA
jgi:hypothetical protein